MLYTESDNILLISMGRLLVIIPLIICIAFTIQVFISIYNKNFSKAGLVFLISTLFFYIDITLYYTFYNFIVHILLITTFSFYYLKYRYSSHIFTKICALTALTLNLLLLFIPNEVIYQFWSRNKISWRKLQWNDFKGNPPEDNYSTYAAVTQSGLNWKINKAFNYPPAIVITYMNTENSWKKQYAKHTKTSDSLLLQHEQIHFDLYELGRRAIVKELNRRWGEPEDSLNHLIRAMAKNATYVGKQYDIQTNHGLNQATQKAWTNKMSQALSK